MDILAMGKAMKAKKAMKKLHDRLGEGVKGNQANVRTRLEQIEALKPDQILTLRVSAMEEKTHINLNKHNLRLSTMSNHQKYRMKEMIFDDFLTADGIDSTKSSNITHDAASHKVTLATGQSVGELVTVAEPVSVSRIAVSMATSAGARDKASLDLSKGVFTNAEFVNGSLQIKKQTDTNFYLTGSYESSIIDLGDNFKSLYKVENTSVLSTGSISFQTATSADGVIFSEYLELNSDGTIASPSNRYIKVKAILTGSGSVQERIVHDFLSGDRNAFQENDKIVFDGSAKLKTSHIEAMTKDATFTEGSLFKVSIRKLEFKSIEKVEVK